MVSFTWQKLGWIVVAVLAGFIIMLWVFPSFGPLQELVGGFVNDTLGAEEVIQVQPPTLPSEHQATLERLRETIEVMVGLRAQDILGDGCFGNYAEIFPPPLQKHSGFPDFGINNQQTAHIEIEYLNNGSTEFSVYGGTGGLQYLPNETFIINGMHPCVIAGNAPSIGLNRPAKNFFNRFIKMEVAEAPIYKSVDYIKLGWSPLGSGNNLRVLESLGIINDVDNNFLDGGWIFTPNGEQICFFPTIERDEENQNGLWSELISGVGHRGVYLSLTQLSREGRGASLCRGLDYSNR